ncbi:MAG: LuxR C-terminal-related transcriptional regulator [Actinomycetota bacterium]
MSASGKPKPKPKTGKGKKQGKDTGPGQTTRRASGSRTPRQSQEDAVRQVQNELPVIRVLVADSQPLLADSLALALQAYHWDFEVLDERPVTAVDVVEIVHREQPDVTLIDFWMEMDAPATTRMILSRDPDQKIIVLSWFHGPREVEHSLDAGAVGFLPKSLKVDQVAEGIRRAHAGERPIFPEQLAEIVRTIKGRDEGADLAWQKLVDLTPREILVLKMLSLGKGVADISKELFVSPSTVRKHIFNTLQKLDAHSQLEAIALARRYGLLQT